MESSSWGGGVGKGMISDLKRGLLNENRKKACSVAKKKEKGVGRRLFTFFWPRFTIPVQPGS